MSYNFSGFKQSVKDIEEWLKKEFSSIRTGRATPAILDGIRVEAYGAPMPINQVGSISVDDARMIRISPWDQSLSKIIEKAITDANLGLSVSAQADGVRVIFPELSSDRRVSLIKLAKQKLEEARVSLRGEREKVLKDIEVQEKDGSISEDDKFRLKTELQKIVDDTGRVLDEQFAKKEKEIAE